MSSFLNLTLVNSLEVLIEEGSFARAAARLCVTPPAMTQQIQRLEGAVGYKLVERGTNPIRLTDRGREFMVHAGAALASSRIALGESTDQEILRIGFINGFPGRRDEGFLADFAAKNPHARLQFIQLEWGDQLSRLARGDVDASLARPPYREMADKMDRIVVHREKRVAAVPIDSPLAACEVLTLGDLDGYAVVGAKGIGREWTKEWVVDPRPSGRAVQYGCWAATMEEAINGVALGGNVMITAQSVANRYQHDGVAYRDIADVDLCQVDLITRATDRRPLTKELRRAALARVDDLATADPAA
ncbi:LysR family transcriptional regulator [Prescottella agglutinans]|uniref:LysR family transcriptional regulator n=1 Tax=Prescottella agglutinans TaxID=1644129 RepID=A0A3S3D120_9NOCA|nr:LysR family transcriptional regulator [Prescottella agglutinans]RVW10500.1 LysR family transcriptional regulator [Prescottella agglutinans]